MCGRFLQAIQSLKVARGHEVLSGWADRAAELGPTDRQAESSHRRNTDRCGDDSADYWMAVRVSSLTSVPVMMDQVRVAAARASALP